MKNIIPFLKHKMLKYKIKIYKMAFRAESSFLTKNIFGIKFDHLIIFLG